MILMFTMSSCCDNILETLEQHFRAIKFLLNEMYLLLPQRMHAAVRFNLV